jgi:hypothetical protein
MARNSTTSPDVFISYAREDEEAIAAPLATVLVSRGVRVWYDRSELELNDRLDDRIFEAINSCRFGVVILSPNFFAKDYTRRELEAFLSREYDGKEAILPVWHNISEMDIQKHSPVSTGGVTPLAQRKAASAADGIETVADLVLRALLKDLRNADGTKQRYPPVTFASVGRSELRRSLDEFTGPGSIWPKLKNW